MAQPIGHRWAAWVVLATLPAGCATSQSADFSPRCQFGQGKPLVAYELFFGRGMPDHREVGEAAWADFLDRVITPNLPDGYTVFDASGYWRNPATGRSAHERSKVLVAVVPDTPQNGAAVARIRAAYAMRFQQTLVGIAVTPACGDF